MLYIALITIYSTVVSVVKEVCPYLLLHVICESEQPQKHKERWCHRVCKQFIFQRPYNKKALWAYVSIDGVPLWRTKEKSEGGMKKKPKHYRQFVRTILGNFFIWFYRHFKKFNLQCFFFYLSVTIIGGIVFLIFALTAFFIEE